MKQRSWLLGCMGLLLVVSACAPLAPPSIDVIVTATQAVVEPADTPEAAVETEVAEAEAEVQPAAPTITFPRAGAELSSQELELTGTGEPGSLAQVLIDGNITGVTEVDSDGNWSLALSLTEPGEHEIAVQLLDAAGNVLAETDPISISAVAPEPSPPAAADESEVEVESEPGSPSITVPEAGFELNSRVLEIAGIGEPGSQLQILVDGEVVDTVTVRSSGGWYVAVSLDQPGEHQLQLQLLDDAGAVAAETAPITISADFETATPPEAETTTPAEADIDVSTEAEEEAPAEPEAAPPIFIFPADQADIFLGNLTLLGVGEPDAEVEVLVDEEQLALVSVGAAGGWALTFQPSLGVHQVSARIPGQKVAEADQIEIRVVTPSDDYDCSSNPGLVLDDIYVVGTCDTLATIGQQLGIDVEELISANPQVDDPDLIYPGEIISLPQ